MSEISVIVPAYNAEGTIQRCLDSLLNQTLKDIDIIVVNDGSKDATEAIVQSYKDKRIRLFSIENQGIAHARNYGLSKVNSPYFGFLDADDYTDPSSFEKMLAKAKETNAEIVVSNFDWVEKENRRLEKEGPYGTHQDMMIHLFAVLWNKLYKTSFVKEADVHFPDGNRYEDACFLYCLCPHVERLAFVDESFVSYVQMEKSITHNNNDEVKNMITVFEIIVDYFKRIGEFENYYSELEYLHVKFFLGNSFLRSAKIKDRNDREKTILMGWNLLNRTFPDWTKNHYLKELPGMKNVYFRCVRRWNIMAFAFIFRVFKK